MIFKIKEIFKRKKQEINSISDFIEHKINKRKKSFRFIQIGGNDGKINDPIYQFVTKYNWTGIIVEPQTEVFNNNLKKTYGNYKNLVLENVAISNKTGVQKLYKLAVSNARWATGLASFNKENLTHHIDIGYVDECAKKDGITLPDNIEDYYTYENVNCITIEDLISKHNFSKIDLLQIDTEGYDYEIIKTINFNKIKPKVISFESKHLSKVDLDECKSLFKNNGYQFLFFGNDSIAYID